MYITKSLSYRKEQDPLQANFDYVRYATLGLCYEEIRKMNIQGNMAEVGVYKGDFAKRLNALFPNKKLYLFDTFNGFNSTDTKVEQEKGYSSGEQDFSDTSIELVKSKMVQPDNCIFRKGFFPETAKDIEDRFCIVSLDADLYQPTYEGLKYFFPRLENGGYIFIHDYNNKEYKGVEEAVKQFCSEQKISFTTIPDSGGSVIISK